MTTVERSARERIASVAADMVAGTVDLLEGCRAIAHLRGSLAEPELSDADLLVLLAVESELEDVPLGPTRQHWAPEGLAAKDQEKAEYLGAAKPEIMRACRALIAKWGA